MRFLLTGDLHFSAYSQDKIDSRTELPERLSSLYFSLNEMMSYAVKNDIQKIIIAGDLFHNKSIIYSTAQSLFLDIVRSNPNITWIILDGNHDLSSMTGDGVSATKCLDNEQNVITIHCTTSIENITFVPWNPKNMINDIKNGNTEYLISHIGLNEGMLNSGISIVSDIGLKDLKKYKKVYFGHYHTPQSIGNTTYIGSLIQLDWNDKNQEKRYLLIDTKTDYELSIPSLGYIKHCEFNITNENKNEILKTITNLKSEGHKIKLNKIEDFDTTEIEKDFDVIDKKEKDITNRGITSDMSTSSKLEKYLEIKEIPKERYDLYKNIAIDIMEGIER